MNPSVALSLVRLSFAKWVELIVPSAVLLKPNELRLEGRWLHVRGRVIGDNASRRIKALIAGPLTKVGTAAGGWDVLYVDPRDGRYWELTYPHGEMHEGGPQALTQIAAADARAKYGIP